MHTKLNPYLVTFAIVFIALIWRPFFIGFYGDDFGVTKADTLYESFFWDDERLERILYFFPIAIPRYFFRHDPISWGFYSITFSSFTAVALFSFFRSVLDRLEPLNKAAIPAAMMGAILYIFMPWSISSVLWDTTITHLFMAGITALAGTVMLSRLTTPIKTPMFVVLFSTTGLMYESFWCMWIPLLLIKLSLDTQEQRKETAIMAMASVAAQALLVWNYMYSFGMRETVTSEGGFILTDKINLFIENIFLRLPFEVLSSMGVMGLVSVPLGLFVAYELFKNRSRPVSYRLWFITLSCLSGILGGVLIISVGNYQVAGTTEDARTLSATSFWLALLAALVVGVLMSKGSRRAKTTGALVYALIVLAFFTRASDWVQGYIFQREAVAAVPAKEIAKIARTGNAAQYIPNNPVTHLPDFDNMEDVPILLVEFGTPMHLFHGMHNNRGAAFISQEIKKRTGQKVFTTPANGRLWKTVLNGTHLYQTACADPDEMAVNYDNIYKANSVIYWNVSSGEVRKVTGSFEHGCTRTVQKYESLGELLYPFMGNPRRF